MRLIEPEDLPIIAAAMAIVHYTIMAARWLFAQRRKAADWLYDQYYEHVHWRIKPPRRGPAVATLKVTVAGSVQVYRDASGQKRARRLNANREIVSDRPLHD